MIYLSGPITNNPTYKKDFETALVKAHAKWGNDVEIFNPCSITGCNTWGEFMQKDLEQLFKCDTILFLEGYKNSKGCKIEKLLAEGLKLKMYYLKHGDIISL